MKTIFAISIIALLISSFGTLHSGDSAGKSDKTTPAQKKENVKGLQVRKENKTNPFEWPYRQKPVTTFEQYLRADSLKQGC